MHRMETMKQSIPWSSPGIHGPLVIMCRYVFPVVVKPEMLTLQLDLALKVKVNRPQNNIDQNYFKPLVRIL